MRFEWLLVGSIVLHMLFTQTMEETDIEVITKVNKNNPYSKAIDDALSKKWWLWSLSREEQDDQACRNLVPLVVKRIKGINEAVPLLHREANKYSQARWKGGSPLKKTQMYELSLATTLLLDYGAQYNAHDLVKSAAYYVGRESYGEMPPIDTMIANVSKGALENAIHIVEHRKRHMDTSNEEELEEWYNKIIIHLVSFKKD